MILGFNSLFGVILYTISCPEEHLSTLEVDEVDVMFGNSEPTMFG